MQSPTGWPNNARSQPQTRQPQDLTHAASSTCGVREVRGHASAARRRVLAAPHLQSPWAARDRQEPAAAFFKRARERQSSSYHHNSRAGGSVQPPAREGGGPALRLGDWEGVRGRGPPVSGPGPWALRLRRPFCGLGATGGPRPPLLCPHADTRRPQAQDPTPDGRTDDMPLTRCRAAKGAPSDPPGSERDPARPGEGGPATRRRGGLRSFCTPSARFTARSLGRAATTRAAARGATARLSVAWGGALSYGPPERLAAATRRRCGADARSGR